MLTQAIRDIAKQSERRARIHDHIKAEVQRGAFLLTPYVCEEEPTRTMCWEAIDGITPDSGIPRPTFERQIECPDVRVLLIDANTNNSRAKNPAVFYKRLKTFTVPGTNRTGEKLEQVALKPDDTLSHRDARVLLCRYGYPNRNHADNDGEAVTGQVVEVAWLEAEAQKPACADGIRELYESLKDRIEAGRAPQPKTQPSAQQQQQRRAG